MVAGKELDETIAWEIMNWIQIDDDYYREIYKGDFKIGNEFVREWDAFNPSTNLIDAWQVVEKLKEKFICKVIGLTNDRKDWFCSFQPIGDGGFGNHSYDKTVSLAICKAALLTTLRET